MKKKERGSYDFTCDGNVFCTVWKDNALVKTMSTVHTHEPLQYASRFKKGVTGRVALTQLLLIKKYNEGMGWSRPDGSINWFKSTKSCSKKVVVDPFRKCT